MSGLSLACVFVVYIEKLFGVCLFVALVCIVCVFVCSCLDTCVVLGVWCLPYAKDVLCVVCSLLYWFAILHLWFFRGLYCVVVFVVEFVCC